MKQSTVAGLKPQNPVLSTFLIHLKERKMASNGNAYLDLELRDSTGIVGAKIWDCDRFDLDFEVGDVVRVEGVAEQYRGNPQIRVRKISKCAAEEYDLRDYLPRSERDSEEMYAGLLARVRRSPEGPIRRLLLSVLEDPAIAEKFRLAPAATVLHHAYLGGLLEHVVSLVGLGDRICDHYPSLDRELVLAGLVLHDLGKIEELSFGREFRYTTRGQLIGHISIGMELVRDKIRALPDFPPALGDQIEHIILSHHGQFEFGSPKQPLFPEALAVHYLDDLDSKLAAMRAQYEAEKDRPGEWTTRNRALGRELLKPEAAGPPEGKSEAASTAGGPSNPQAKLPLRHGQD